MHGAEEIMQLTTQGGIKELLVDNLLDSRLSVDESEAGDLGHTFRLQRYTEFKYRSELTAYLDQLNEDRYSQRSEHKKVNNDYCQELTITTTKEATESLNKVSCWRTIAKRDVRILSTLTNQYQQFLAVQTRDLEERIHRLNIEYVQVAKERDVVYAEVAKLESLLTAHQNTLKQAKEDNFEAQKQIVKNTVVKLSSVKTEQATYDHRLNACLKQLEGFKAQLTQKRKML